MIQLYTVNTYISMPLSYPLEQPKFWVASYVQQHQSAANKNIPHTVCIILLICLYSCFNCIILYVSVYIYMYACTEIYHYQIYITYTRASLKWTHAFYIDARMISYEPCKVSNNLLLLYCIYPSLLYFSPLIRSNIFFSQERSRFRPSFT